VVGQPERRLVEGGGPLGQSVDLAQAGIDMTRPGS
jgi:hypothetical protein